MSAPPTPHPSAIYRYVEVADGGVDHRGRVKLLEQVDGRGKTDQYVTYGRCDISLLTWLNTHKNRTGRPTTADFDGLIWTDRFHMDIDAKDLEKALVWTRTIYQRLVDWGVPIDAIRIYYSGSKGFHLEVPAACFGGFLPSAELHRALKAAATLILQDITFDPSVYNKLRLWRLENTLNSKGRFKIRLTAGELLARNLGELQALALAVRDYPEPDIDIEDWLPVPDLVEIWRQAQEEASKPASSGPAAALGDDERDRITAAAIGASWPRTDEHGARPVRHDYLLAIGGYLARRTSQEHVAELLKAGAAASGDDEREWNDEINRIAESTSEKVAAGTPVVGLPRLAEQFPGLAKAIGALWEEPFSTLQPSVGRLATPGFTTTTNGTTGRIDNTTATADSEGPETAITKRGLIRTLAEHVLQRVAIARDVGGLLYVFEHGVYTPRGKQIIQRGVQALLSDWNMSPLWTSKLAAEVHEYIRVTAPELWERPPLDTINLHNGLLDTRSGTLMPHDPTHLSSVQLPVDFDPAAACPAWEKFVSEVFPEDARMLAWELVAWLMTPDTSIQKAVLLMGAGANGKSTYLRGLLAFLGKRMTASLSLQKIESDKFAVSRLVGKLANICPDLPSGHLDSTSTFKALTGGDILNAERKYADSFEFEPFARLVFSANHAPRSSDASEAFFRRWQVIPFARRFKAANDPERESGDGVAIERRDLDATLADPKELSGVLNQALALLPSLRKRGFSTPASVRAASEEFRATTDPLSIWLDRHTLDAPDAYVVRDDLRKAYRKDCGEHGRPTLTDTAFGIAFKRARPTVTEIHRTLGGVRKWCYLGLGLLVSPAQGVQGVQGSANCFVSQPEAEGETEETEETEGINNRENPVHPVHPEHLLHKVDAAAPPEPPPAQCFQCKTAEAGLGGRYCAECMAAYYQEHPDHRPGATL